MSKKDVILKMFNDSEWVIQTTFRFKTITYDDFMKNGLSPTIEYGEKYCDVIYAKRIFKSMGFSVSIGTNIYINDLNVTP